MIALVVAMAENNVIGKNNQLIWHLPADLKHFKNLTTGHPIIMGRKTYESIGKPLPNRTNIVITRQEDFKPEGCLVAHSLPEALMLAQQLDANIFVIGGAEIYKQAMFLADTIYLTEVHHEFEGDTFFPEIDTLLWVETDREEHKADDKNPYDYAFVTLTAVE
ncbi:dihydrofolate reductase [Adhaeribacter sp. BT258]|uniref:Dihydrofolate reductase n=1 Tax=Adhaeribacter terrigena TaxID=2793070 RepID=A0ABS1C5U7_9BACT|nr:dihydrofolate reductase [Adhaeribacter terrigena]MBK0404586.1 dihydrofolate reductase [Adhaeribacter terrigena]